MPVVRLWIVVEDMSMSKYSKAIYALLAAVGFYAFFGIFLPDYIFTTPHTNTAGAADAVRSISPVTRAVVIAITLVLVAQSIALFLRARKK